ncbi:MAG: hypothetical protein AAF899_19670 [Pseudomonadota bacterium]
MITKSETLPTEAASSAHPPSTAHSVGPAEMRQMIETLIWDHCMRSWQETPDETA